MTGDNNGWGEYSRLVLKELETLAKGIEGLKNQIGDLKSEIAELKAKEDKVKELSAWKDRVDEVASPTQLKEMQDMVKKHELFKTKAITMFAVVQIMMAGLMTILKFKVALIYKLFAASKYTIDGELMCLPQLINLSIRRRRVG